jgi:hypothetical protein
LSFKKLCRETSLAEEYTKENLNRPRMQVLNILSEWKWKAKFGQKQGVVNGEEN